MGSSTSKAHSSNVSEYSSDTDGYSETTASSSSTSDDQAYQWVLVIAIEQPPGHTERLTAVVNDVEFIRNRASHIENLSIVADFDAFGDGRTATTPATLGNIEKAVRRSCRLGGRGCIFYLGHGLQDFGESTSYWWSSDGQKIYGRDFLKWLDGSQTPSTSVTLVIDACSSASFIHLPFIYDGSGAERHIFPSAANNQLIVVAAAQSNQKTNTIVFENKWHGAMLLLLLRHSERSKTSTASQLVKHLRDALAAAPKHKQSPQISARFPLGDNPISIF